MGGHPKDILQQILSESMVLTTIAGMAGISFGVLILQLMEIGVNSGKDHYSHFQVSFGMAIGTCPVTGDAGTTRRTGTRLQGNGYPTDRSYQG